MAVAIRPIGCFEPVSFVANGHDGISVFSACKKLKSSILADQHTHNIKIHLRMQAENEKQKLLGGRGGKGDAARPRNNAVRVFCPL